MYEVANYRFNLIIAQMQNARQAEQSGDYRRKRHYEHVRIRKENRKVIFCRKRYCPEENKANPSDMNGWCNIPMEEQSAQPYRLTNYGELSSDRQYSPGEAKIEQSNEHKPQESDGRFDIESIRESSNEPSLLPDLGDRQIKIISVKERAEEMYGSKQHFPKNWAKPINKKNVVLDQNLSDFIQDILYTNYTLEHLEDAINELKSPEDILTTHCATIIIRKLISRHRDQIRSISLKLIDNELLQLLINMLKQTDYKQLRLEAGWILSNIASSDESICEKVVQSGCIEPTINILKEGDPYLEECAVWILGNISGGEGPKLKNATLDQNALHQLIKVAIKTDQDVLFENCIWSITNLMVQIDYIDYSREMQEGINFLCDIIEAGDVNYQNTAFNTCISVLSRLMHTHSQHIALTGIIPFFTKLLSQDLPIFKQTKETLVKLVSGFLILENSCIIQLMLNHGIIDLIHLLILSSNEIIVQEGLFMLSTIIIEDSPNTNQILQNRDLILFCANLLNSENAKIRSQACIVFTNMAIKGKHQTVFLYYKQIDVLQAVFSILCDADSDQFIVRTALQLLLYALDKGQMGAHKEKGRNVFTEGLIRNGRWLDVLFAMQSHQSTGVTATTSYIIQEYFKEFSEVHNAL